MIITALCMALFTAFAFTSAFPMRACALESEGDLYYNNKVQDLMIYVYYEKPGVKIRLMDPDGNILDQNSRNAEYVETDSMMMILVKNAGAGQWKLLYDKGPNASIRADCQPYDKPIWITSLTTAVSGADLNVAFDVSQEEGEGRAFEYEVRLGIDEAMNEYRSLGTGRGRVGEKVEQSFSLKDINSHTDYYVQVFVFYDQGAQQNFDWATDGPISYTNPDAAQPLEDYVVELHQSYGYLNVDLEDYVSYDAKRAHVQVEADGSVISDQLVDLADFKDAGTTFEKGTKEFTVKVSVEYSNGRMSDELVKTFSYAPDPAAGDFVLTLRGSGPDNQFHYFWENAKDQTVIFTPRNKYPVEVVLNASGSDAIELEEDVSVMEVRYTDRNNVCRVLEQQIHVDNAPPELKLYEQLNGMVTDKATVLITGKTEAGCSLTCNDEPVEIAENGTFTYEFKLEPGENTAAFRATDASGNSSLHSLTIKRGEEEKEEAEKTGISSNKTINAIFNKIPLIAGIATFLLGLTELTLFLTGLKNREKYDSMMTAMAVVLLVFSAAALIFNIAYFTARSNFQNSSDYVNLALDDQKAAYNFLAGTQASGSQFVWFIMATVLSAAALGFSVYTLVKNAKSRPKTPPMQGPPFPPGTPPMGGGMMPPGGFAPGPVPGPGPQAPPNMGNAPGPMFGPVPGPAPQAPPNMGNAPGPMPGPMPGPGPQGPPNPGNAPGAFCIQCGSPLPPGAPACPVCGWRRQ